MRSGYEEAIVFVTKSHKVPHLHLVAIQDGSDLGSSEGKAHVSAGSGGDGVHGEAEAYW